MTDSQARAVAKTTPDLLVEQVEKLAQLFPECFTEDAEGTRRQVSTSASIAPSRRTRSMR